MNQLPHCIVCSTESPFLLKKDGYDLYRCSTCALVFVHPLPKSDFLKDEVYSYESGYQSNKKGNYSDKPRDKKTKKTFEVLEDLDRGGKLLDVGCSNGEFMHYAGLQGFETYGVELNRRTAEVAKAAGLNVFNGYLHDAKFENNFFDVVYLGDVIEHVPSPHDLVAECKRILKPGGLLVISTPNLNCFWSRSTWWLYKLFKIPWSSLTPPYHLHQFSDNNLYRLMRSHQFSKEADFYLRPPRLMYELGSLHVLKKFKREKSPLSLLFALFSVAAYTLFYIDDIIVTPLKSRDFAMVMFYQKN